MESTLCLLRIKSYCIHKSTVNSSISIRLYHIKLFRSHVWIPKSCRRDYQHIAMRGGFEVRFENTKTIPPPAPMPRQHNGVVSQEKAIESAGMKYVHSIEAYLTTTLSEKVRDNYHCVLITRNCDVFLS